MLPEIKNNIDTLISYSDEIDNIIAPLKETFNINFFNYSNLRWHFRDIKTYWLGNHRDWLNYYYEHQLYLRNENLPDTTSNGIYFIDDYRKPNSPSSDMAYIQRILQDKFDICHVTIIAQHHLGYSEYYMFGVPSDVDDFNKNFLLHKKYFKQFIIYFKDKAFKILKDAKRSAYSLTDLINKTPLFYFNSTKNETKTQIVNNLSIQRYFLDGKYENIYLTPRETECLLLLCNDLYYAEIAKKLNISPATVREHIDNIKRKLYCKSKKDLIKTARQEGILEMINDYLPDKETNNERIRQREKAFFSKTKLDPTWGNKNYNNQQNIFIDSILA